MEQQTQTAKMSTEKLAQLYNLLTEYANSVESEGYGGVAKNVREVRDENVRVDLQSPEHSADVAVVNDHATVFGNSVSSARELVASRPKNLSKETILDLCCILNKTKHVSSGREAAFYISGALDAKGFDSPSTDEIYDAFSKE